MLVASRCTISEAKNSDERGKSSFPAAREATRSLEGTPQTPLQCRVLPQLEDCGNACRARCRATPQAASIRLTADVGCHMPLGDSSRSGDGTSTDERESRGKFSTRQEMRYICVTSSCCGHCVYCSSLKAVRAANASHRAATPIRWPGRSHEDTPPGGGPFIKYMPVA